MAAQPLHWVASLCPLWLEHEHARLNSVLPWPWLWKRLCGLTILFFVFDNHQVVYTQLLPKPGFKSTTSRSQGQCLNHLATSTSLSSSRSMLALTEEFSSVQFKMVSKCSGKPICAPPHVSEVSPMLPLIQFQCWSDWHHMALARTFKVHNVDRTPLPFSTPLSSRQLMVWCLWFLCQ